MISIRDRSVYLVSVSVNWYFLENWYRHVIHMQKSAIGIGMVKEFEHW